jgi:hypothetical protein
MVPSSPAIRVMALAASYTGRGDLSSPQPGEWACRGMAGVISPLRCLAGRSALPLDPGTVATVACRETTRGKRWSQRSRPLLDQAAGRWSAQVPGWLVEGLRLVVGHASTVRPDPSTLGAVGERGSHHEGRSPARSRQTPSVL